MFISCRSEQTSVCPPCACRAVGLYLCFRSHRECPVAKSLGDRGEHGSDRTQSGAGAAEYCLSPATVPPPMSRPRSFNRSTRLLLGRLGWGGSPWRQIPQANEVHSSKGPPGTKGIPTTLNEAVRSGDPPWSPTFSTTSETTESPTALGVPPFSPPSFR